MRFTEQEMAGLQAQTQRANQNIARTGGNDVIRLLAEPTPQGGQRTPERFAVDLIHNPSTLAGLPSTLYTVALRSGEEARGRPLSFSPLPSPLPRAAGRRRGAGTAGRPPRARHRRPHRRSTSNTAA